MKQMKYLTIIIYYYLITNTQNNITLKMEQKILLCNQYQSSINQEERFLLEKKLKK